MHVRVSFFLTYFIFECHQTLFFVPSMLSFCVRLMQPKKNILTDTNTVKSWAHARKSSFHFFSFLHSCSYNSFIPFWRSTNTFSIQSLLRSPWQDINFIFASFIATSIVMFSIKKGNFLSENYVTSIIIVIHQHYNSDQLRFIKE